MRLLGIFNILKLLIILTFGSVSFLCKLTRLSAYETAQSHLIPTKLLYHYLSLAAEKLLEYFTVVLRKAPSLCRLPPWHLLCTYTDD